MKREARINIVTTPKFKELLKQLVEDISDRTGRKITMTECIELAVIEKMRREKRKR